ncbi:MAG: MFS transporter [Coriobacteriia bacterium]|nr:MFS transporter [Coriobacteriia bacterium]
MSSQDENKRYYGWTIVFCSFVVIFLSFSIRGSFGVFLTPMANDLGWSTTALSAGLSIFMVCYGITAMFAGAMLDKVGPKPVFLVHGVLLGLGLFLSSFSKEPWQFYLTYGLIAGVGAGALFAPPTQLVRKWFIKDLGKALGITTGACGLGFGLAPIVAMNLIEVMPWQTAMQVLGVILAVGVCAVALLTKPTPESIGIHPPGYEEAQKAAAEGAQGVGDYSFTLGEAMKKTSWWLLALAWFCSNFSEFTCLSHSLNYAKTEIMLEPVKATYLYSISGFIYLCIGAVAGIAIDRLTVKFSNDAFKARKLMLLITYSLACLACIAMYYVKGYASYGFYSALFGLASGSYIPSIVGYSGEMFGRAHAGKVWGTLTLIGMGGGAGLGPVLAGYLKDTTGSYGSAIIASAISYACAAFITQIIQRPKIPVAASAGSDEVAETEQELAGAELQPAAAEA